MIFSLAILLSQTDDQSARAVFREAVEQVQFAESLGFHAVWMTEQHFNRWGICPDPLTFAAHLAGVTTRIRLGTSVVVLSLHNPVVIAERAALLDQLSDGRLDFGIGKGHARHKYDAFGIDPAENEARFIEAHDLIVKAWTEEEFTFHGQFFHADNIKLSPRPAQQPHPPIWVATFGNPGAG
jgi:alkanesulfonate monooxygenase SsuD/methylene tetrahydromethanopterin reductase-like flavin-dependent oxidoreductase (luciferase family)